VGRALTEGREREGFTLIELMMVVITLGALAAISVPKIQAVLDRGNVTVMTADLRKLVTAEEDYFVEHDTYTVSPMLAGMVPSPDVTITIGNVSPAGWEAEATHAKSKTTCRVYSGDRARSSATEGVPTCSASRRGASRSKQSK
jgi:prepilin-type N-terminal cleavage/methylation domain-containing protein